MPRADLPHPSQGKVGKMRVKKGIAIMFGFLVLGLVLLYLSQVPYVVK